MPSALLVQYHPDRGFGFLGRRPNSHFVHLRAFWKAGLEPTVGEYYRYDTELDREGRPRAINITLDNGFEDV